MITTELISFGHRIKITDHDNNIYDIPTENIEHIASGEIRWCDVPYLESIIPIIIKEWLEMLIERENDYDES